MITAKDVKNEFGHFLEMMSEKVLADKVVTAWVNAAEEGRWKSMDELKEMPFTLLTDTHGINFIQHTIAVTRGAIGLMAAQIETYGNDAPYTMNKDVLIAGGLLHDVGKLVEIEPDGQGGYRKSYSGKIARHPISGTVIAAQAGITGPVLNTIACHAKEGENRPQRIETILIHQADFATFNPMVYMNKGNLIADE